MYRPSSEIKKICEVRSLSSRALKYSISVQPTFDPWPYMYVSSCCVWDTIDSPIPECHKSKLTLVNLSLWKRNGPFGSGRKVVSGQTRFKTIAIVINNDDELGLRRSDNSCAIEKAAVLMVSWTGISTWKYITWDRSMLFRCIQYGWIDLHHL